MPDLSKFLANLVDPQKRAQMAEFLSAQGIAPPAPEEAEQFIAQLSNGAPSAIPQLLQEGAGMGQQASTIPPLAQIISPAQVNSQAQPGNDLAQTILAQMLGRGN